MIGRKVSRRAVGADGPFSVGDYRPIYLWGGPGTIRMNRLKFPTVEVDEPAHLEIHSEVGPRIVVDSLNCNWAHLMYDWGFPPETEREDWDSFERAAALYHAAGSPVFAYVQASNCVRRGSYAARDWYARDRAGRLVPYFVYPDRFMTCLDDPEWRDRVRIMIAGAIARGADGVFFDNVFQGDQAVPIFGAWLGSTGCHCGRCRERYAGETGEAIPTQISPQDEAFQQFLRWRAAQVTGFLAAMAEFANELRPGIPVSANDYDPVVRNAYLIYGIDLAALAEAQDVAMIENYGLPQWEGGPKARLANNALTIRNARQLVRGRAHLSMLSYDVAIGFDPVYPTRRYLQGMAEAAACGASMTTKGSEYNDGSRMTLLTAREYKVVRTEIGRYQRWLERNAGLYRNSRSNASRVGLLHPGRELWHDWMRLSPLFYGAGQALTAAGIPWRVVRVDDPKGCPAGSRAGDPARSLADSPEENRVDDLEVLLVFSERVYGNVAVRDRWLVVFVPGIEGWEWPEPSFLARTVGLRRMLSNALRAGLDLYKRNPLVRRLVDRTGAPAAFMRSDAYRLPADARRRALLRALPRRLQPCVVSRDPVLIEVWSANECLQVHLVNYAAEPQEVRLDLPRKMAGRAVSPDRAQSQQVEGESLTLPLDVYELLILE